jgi:ABC-type Zn uptake system ZnuABC Zn-binding protein ZnuA
MRIDLLRGTSSRTDLPREDTMRQLVKCVVMFIALVASVPAWADLKVATALEDLASVAQFVGGKHVSAFSLCRGYEDPHFVPAKPSLMRAIRNADVFVSVGLELDSGWLPMVLPGSRNPRIQPGAPGFVDASDGVTVLEKPTGTVSRAEGDVHPLGNPHYYLDPLNLKVVANHLAEVFARLDPANAAEYADNAKAFGEKMNKALAAWEKDMEPFKGMPVVTFHKNYDYFLSCFGLKLLATVELKPGIPPTPRHLAETAEAMKKAGARVVLYQPYQDSNACEMLAKKAGAVALEVPSEVGGVPQAKDVFAKFDFIVASLVKTLASK